MSDPTAYPFVVVKPPETPTVAPHRIITLHEDGTRIWRIDIETNGQTVKGHLTWAMFNNARSSALRMAAEYVSETQRPCYIMIVPR